MASWRILTISASVGGFSTEWMVACVDCLSSAIFEQIGGNKFDIRTVTMCEPGPDEKKSRLSIRFINSKY